MWLAFSIFHILFPLIFSRCSVAFAISFRRIPFTLQRFVLTCTQRGGSKARGEGLSSWSCASSAGSLQRLSSDLAVINVASRQLQLQLQLHFWLQVWSCKSEKCLLFMRRYDKKKENTEKYWKQGMLDYETRWSCRNIDVCWGFYLFLFSLKPKKHLNQA